MKKVKDVTCNPSTKKRAIVTCPPSRDAYPAEIFPAEEDGSRSETEGAVQKRKSRARTDARRGGEMRTIRREEPVPGCETEKRVGS